MIKVSTLLPIGSVVLLKNGQKRVMIFGVKQLDNPENGTEFDYIGVPYPEGNMGIDFQYLFNHENIEQVFFVGYTDEEREKFINELSLLITE